MDPGTAQAESGAAMVVGRVRPVKDLGILHQLRERPAVALVHEPPVTWCVMLSGEEFPEGGVGRFAGQE
jgi:hypothetical protein